MRARWSHAYATTVISAANNDVRLGASARVRGTRSRSGRYTRHDMLQVLEGFSGEGFDREEKRTRKILTTNETRI